MGRAVKRLVGSRSSGSVLAMVLVLGLGASVTTIAGPAWASPSASELETLESGADPSADDPVEGEDASSSPGLEAEPDAAPEVVEGAEGAEPAPEGSEVEDAVEDSSASQAGSLPPSAGLTVPGQRNEVASDVLGRGYEQVIRLNDSKVEIVEPSTRGSQVIRSFEVGASAEWPSNHYPPLGSTRLFFGGKNIAEKLEDHSASRLAVAGGHIYVSNVRSRKQGIDKGEKLVEDGSVIKKYSANGALLNTREEATDYAVTALDAFVWQNETYLAIGLNTTGVRVVKTNVDRMPDVYTAFTGWNGRGKVLDQARDQVSDVKLGTDGDGRLLLAAGRMTSEGAALEVADLAAKKVIWTQNHRPAGVVSEWPGVMSFGAFGPEGRQHLAVGWPSIGRLNVYDTSTGKEVGAWQGDRVNVVRFFTDAFGEPRIGFRSGAGEMMRAHIARIDASGSFAVVETVAGLELEYMVPGYRAYSMQVENRSRAEISIKGYTGPTRVNGCWLAGALKGVAGTLPTQAVRIKAGAKGGPYASAHRLSGEQCWSGSPGVFYLQVELPGEPGHRRIVQVQGEWRGLQIKEQVGSGRLTVHLEPHDVRVDGYFGARLVVTDRYAAPELTGTPKLEAIRLTPAPATGRAPTDRVDDPARPVHRFTVSGVSWQVPGAGDDLTEAVLPLPTAEGSVDGRTWHSLGTVASPVAPSRDGDRVTMGDALFDWQTTPGATNDFRYFRVKTGAQMYSNTVDVHPLPVPAATTLVTGVSIVEAGAPRANGLDQSPMRVSLIDGALRPMDPVVNAELYRRIYFRDATTQALITGLGDPSDPSQLVMFSLRPGQYANETGGSEASTSIGAYFSTRSTQPGRKVKAMFKHNAISYAALEGVAPLSPVANLLVPAQGSTGTGGVSISKCLEGPCTLADPERAPALHSLTSSSVSVQLRSILVQGGASLPLIDPHHYGDELTIAKDSFTYQGSRATLRNPGGLGYNAAIAGQLITHGERVALESLYV